MVAVAPFRALRYRLEAVGELSHVVAPPYDVIGPEEQERLYAASPYNVVRLILGKQSSADTEQDNRYSRARRDYEAWRRDTILAQDASPSFSLIEHLFTWQGLTQRRLGFLGLLELDDASRAGPAPGGVAGVLRHEETLGAPKADRKQLLEAVPANLSPIFCVYPDPQGGLQAQLTAWAARGTPKSTARRGDETVRVWVLTDPAAIRAIQEHLAKVAVLIADGHHRYEVASANRERYGAVMTYFVSMADPGLRVQPIHRLVQPPAPADVAHLDSMASATPAQDLDTLLAWLNAEHQGRFGCAVGQSLYQVEIRPERRAQWLRQAPEPAPLATLDVSMLHGLIFPALGIQPGQLSYTADAVEAASAAAGGRAAMAWLMRGLPVEQVYDVAAHGVTLPPKSTYFYPKVWSGLAFNPFAAGS